MYRFKQDEKVAEGVRRIAAAEIQKACDRTDGSLPLEQAVHEARKCCKKLRGLLRLIQPVFDGFDVENAAFRDAARGLSGARDRAVLLKSLDVLERQAMAPYGAAFEAARDWLGRGGDPEADGELLTAFRSEMAQAAERIDGWKIDASGFDALAPGLSRIYRRARRRMRPALKAGNADDIHEWRKQVKHHGYHIRLLSPVWLELMAVYAQTADDLGELLGDHHDLAILRERLDAAGDELSGDHVAHLKDLVDTRHDDMLRQAATMGHRLFADEEDARVAAWRRFWKSWRSADSSGGDR